MEYVKYNLINKKNSRGFTMVELMVVVGLIGIMLAIAIPKYQAYQWKTRQAEARNSLGQVFLSEKAFRADGGSYSACLSQIGVRIDEAPVRFYTFGFSTALANSTCGPNGNQSCLSYEFDREGATLTACAAVSGSVYFPANATSVSSDTPPTDALLPAGVTDLTRDRFRVQAVGMISTAGRTDQWSIDETQNIVNGASGL